MPIPFRLSATLFHSLRSSRAVTRPICRLCYTITDHRTLNSSLGTPTFVSSLTTDSSPNSSPPLRRRYKNYTTHVELPIQFYCQHTTINAKSFKTNEYTLHLSKFHKETLEGIKFALYGFMTLQTLRVNGLRTAANLERPKSSNRCRLIDKEATGFAM